MDIPRSWLGPEAARKAAITATILALAVIAVPLTTSFWALHSETSEALSQLGIYRAEMDLKPKLEAELAATKARAANGTGLIVADDSALAEAELQRDMKSLVENNAAEVRSSQTSSKKAVGGLEEIAVQYDLSVPITRLSPLLYAIESHSPYFFIDQAAISGGLAWQSPQIGKKQPEPKLDVRLTVRAYRWSAK
jgi:hypothetical protein